MEAAPSVAQMAVHCHDVGAQPPLADCCKTSACPMLTAACASLPEQPALGAPVLFLAPGGVQLRVRQPRAPPAVRLAARPSPHFPARPDVLLI